LSRWRRQQRKRARRARVTGADAAEFIAKTDKLMAEIERGFISLREACFRLEVSAFEARLRREAREEDEARRVG
jgi:hypothetical protein